jgi:hypothetical protein
VRRHTPQNRPKSKDSQALSGGHQNGFHIDIPFAMPVSVEVARRYVALVKSELAAVGVVVCTTTPGMSGKGGGYWKLPLGKHPTTGVTGVILDPVTLEPVKDPLTYLLDLRRLEVTATAPEPTHELPAPHAIGTLPATIESRACLKRLWTEGLQEPSTRHSAMCAIANAIARLRGMKAEDKRMLYLDWVARTYPGAEDAGLAEMTFAEAIQEAERIWEIYSRRRLAVSCANDIFSRGMRSACSFEDELRCRLYLNGGKADFALTVKLGLWAAPNSRYPGLGKTALAVYLACWEVETEYRAFVWNGAPAFSLPVSQLQAMANISKPTTLKWRKKLVEAGLLVRVPPAEVPREVWDETEWAGAGKAAGFYALPPLTERTIANALSLARRPKEDRTSSFTPHIRGVPPPSMRGKAALPIFPRRPAPGPSPA